MSSRCLRAVAIAVLLAMLGSEMAFAQAPGNVQGMRKFEDPAAPNWVERTLWAMGYFTVIYLGVMAIMALGGVILASKTRGTGALHLLGVQPDELVTEGQVIRTQHESILAQLYAMGLLAGLVLFYIAIPFIVTGLLGVTAALLYLLLMLGRVPIKLLLIVLVVGLTMAWAVLKSIFARANSGSFGLLKGPDDCPKLYAVINDVARRVDTDPVTELYIAPGSSIGVHQEGRGPFGIFGVKRRVLTLGLSTMHYLTVSELQAILAHEYAHFSHKDTFYSRFIYQVQLSIETAIDGMGEAGGHFNYVNPFFWFLFGYYKSYSLLSSGFSRSREYLADRMAVSLFGSDVFVSGLTKVSTDGTLFEMTMYEHVHQLLAEDKAFINMYATFRELRDEAIKPEDREELYQKILNEEGSLFASHPTFKERVEAVMQMPRAREMNNASALQLFNDPEQIEKELTEFMTEFMSYMRHLQEQMATEQASGGV